MSEIPEGWTRELLRFLEDKKAEEPMPTFMELHRWRGNNPDGHSLWPIHLCGLM